MSTAPTPPPPPTNCLRTLYDVLHEVNGIKMRFHHCNDELIFVIWLNMCKNVPETVQWIEKFRILWKNGLNFKLKRRDAQKSILSGRFGALTGRPGELMKNLETAGKTGRVGSYVLWKTAQILLSMHRHFFYIFEKSLREAQNLQGAGTRHIIG